MLHPDLGLLGLLGRKGERMDSPASHLLKVNLLWI